MDKYNEFIGLFNELNQYLNSKYNLKPNTTFGNMLIECESREPVIRHYRNELDRINDLRNLIIHESDRKGPLAIPSNDLISRLDFFLKKIKNPEQIGSKFKGIVKTFDISSSLNEVLLVIREKNYTQFPIFNKDEFVGMLTENGIATWLASKIEEEIIMFEDIIVEDIIKKEEGLESYKVLKTNKTIYDVYDVFSKREEHKGPLVILISKTDSIRKPDDILGIITHWDIKDIDK